MKKKPNAPHAVNKTDTPKTDNFWAVFSSSSGQSSGGLGFNNMLHCRALKEASMLAV